MCFSAQLFERELRRWAGHEKAMSLSSHALYDGNQVNTPLLHNKFKQCLQKKSVKKFLVWFGFS